MFNTLAKFFENLNFNLRTGGLSDIEAFLYYGILFMIVYYFAFGRGKNFKMHGMVLVGSGAIGIAINRYRKAAFAVRVDIMKQEGMSKDTAYITDTRIALR